MTMDDHERHREDLAPYALGALPDEQAEALERHLRTCADCRRDLSELRMGADALARSVAPVEPPDSLREKLMAAVADEAGPAVDAEPEAVEPRRRARRALRPKLPRARRRVSLRPAFAVLAAGLVAAAVGVAGWTLGRAAVEEERSLAATVDRGRLPGASGKLEVAADGGAMLHMRGLRNLGPERTYETWVQRDGELTPGSLFNPTPGGTAVTGIPGNAGDIEAVYVTRERAGGTRTPTEDPVVSVAVSS
jgi:anti-sigma factor RsiW